MFGKRREARRQRELAELQSLFSNMQVHHDHGQKPDMRVNALAFSIQSYGGGSSATTSDLSVRAESFYLFLVDQPTAEKGAGA